MTPSPGSAPRPMRILRVITRLNVGGPARHVIALTTGLDPTRFESRLITGVAGPQEGDMLELSPSARTVLGDRVEYVSALGRDPTGGGDLRALREIDRAIRRFRPHILETHLAKAGTLARVAGIARKVPVRVHVFHGTSFAGHFREPIGRTMAWWERRLARGTDAVVAVSEAVAHDLRTRGFPQDRLHVIPLGLDLDPFLAVPQVPFPPPPVVTTIARVAPVKDIPLFIDAVSRARASIPNLEGVIVGDGPLRSDIERNSPGWIRWRGLRSDLPAELSQAGAVALSSRSEGSPMALIEALAAGRPVVAVSVGGVADLLDGRSGAILVHERTVAALAEGIVRALSDETIVRGAETGRGKVVAEFGVRRLLADMEKFYEEVWSRKGAGARNRTSATA